MLDLHERKDFALRYYTSILLIILHFFPKKTHTPKIEG